MLPRHQRKQPDGQPRPKHDQERLARWRIQKTKTLLRKKQIPSQHPLPLLRRVEILLQETHAKPQNRNADQHQRTRSDKPRRPDSHPQTPFLTRQNSKKKNPERKRKQPTFSKTAQHDERSSRNEPASEPTAKLLSKTRRLIVGRVEIEAIRRSQSQGLTSLTNHRIRPGIESPQTSWLDPFFRTELIPKFSRKKTEVRPS